MRVQVLTPFHWDGVLRVRGDVLEGDAAQAVWDDPDYRARVVRLADADEPDGVFYGRDSHFDLVASPGNSDIPDAPAEPDTHPVEPPMADEHDEEH